VEADIVKNINTGLDIISEIGNKAETIVNISRESSNKTNRPLDPMIGGAELQPSPR